MSLMKEKESRKLFGQFLEYTTRKGMSLSIYKLVDTFLISLDLEKSQENFMIIVLEKK